MERKFLAGLGIENEVIDKILDQNSIDIGKHKIAAETALGRVATLEQDILTKDADLATLRAVDTTDLQGKLDTLQKLYDTEVQARQNQEAKHAYEERRATFFGDTSFADAYAKRGVLAEFDEKAFDYSETENAFTGAKEWLEQLQAAAPSVFTVQSTAPSVVRGTQNTQPPAVTKEAFAKMGYFDRVALKAKDPALYEALKE